MEKIPKTLGGESFSADLLKEKTLIRIEWVHINGRAIATGDCPLCGRKVGIATANKIGVHCRYEGAQFDQYGVFLFCGDRGKPFDQPKNIVLDYQKAIKVFTAWHVDEYTDDKEAEVYAIRLIERLRREAKP